MHAFSHNNDPVGHIHDMLSYQSTVQYVQQWVKAQNERGTQTMLISVSDHETGGLSVGRQITSEYPEYLWCVSLASRSLRPTSRSRRPRGRTDLAKVLTLSRR